MDNPNQKPNQEGQQQGGGQQQPGKGQQGGQRPEQCPSGAERDLCQPQRLTTSIGALNRGRCRGRVRAPADSSAACTD